MSNKCGDVLPVAYEIAGVSGAIWISFAVDDRAFAAVATVHREFGF